ncbi:DUF2161 domain-containing phosphodiesterase [Pontivivens insulae]|uniref:Uncharacterized protein n=1 Tax=Pontivivens insulae TaxID=1639689 RepID=A0A2R8A7G5_9RHOB|nr:DUF2161 family putative PD-(D/E)XK-type phosphodiesterase [Pontivivens insulae]RED18248.1 hypothetical protein DFR53_0443 [Pontivivens insulae]SPF28146.1 hypothetical protein POI8812_00444 [Pontivivens insulae]
MSEAKLYQPVKALLEAQGYTVKGEIGPVDLMAVRGDDPPVVVELKTGLTMALLLQGVDRLALTDHVYLAVPKLPARGRKGWARVKAMLRRLGLGLIVVREGIAEVHLDPGPYAPRGNKARTARLLKEFQLREGDPSPGGVSRTGIMTAYRQACIRLADHLAEHGPTKASVAGAAVGAEKAAQRMRDNHYGWFERVAVGVYDLTPNGRAAHLERLAASVETNSGE